MAAALEGSVTVASAGAAARGAGLPAMVVLSPDGALAAVQVREGRLRASGPSPFFMPADVVARLWRDRYGGQGSIIVDAEAPPSPLWTERRHPFWLRLVPAAAPSDRGAARAFVFTPEGEAVASLPLALDPAEAGLVPSDPAVRRPLAVLDRFAVDHCLIEHGCLAPFAWHALTPCEREAGAGLPARRGRAFTAARLALKRLARRMGLAALNDAASTLETVDTRNPRPLLPGARGAFFSSVSHDRRFALAVAGTRPLGVDIEVVSPKLAAARHIFMGAEEIRIADRSCPDPARAAALVWTAKEAAAKALDMHLVDAWHDVRLVELGSGESVFRWAGFDVHAVHAGAWGRMVSLVARPAGA